jgi:uncharacterized protein YcnI
VRIDKQIGFLAVVVAVLVAAASAFAHVRVSPRESTGGAMERYTMRVPTERQSATVRTELEVPNAVTIVSIAPAEGWKIEEKKNAQGKIVGVIWSGGSIPFAEYREFVFEAKNPSAATKLEWKVIQIYEDGTRSEWTGPEASRSPASVTTIKAAASR